ncbi:hypothetical protein BT93_L1362 [Corymbia citriodora subsp. variegata]|uniref:Secreted protein n=1 Tax=Corymbia citriodora subsp. variegata TaxID=360336 RepID=A0A8T0CST5_CORYI|nr:hypothetical protein BT93_L1362 [Corymbia citriodora subsp. variegata]
MNIMILACKLYFFLCINKHLVVLAAETKNNLLGNGFPVRSRFFSMGQCHIYPTVPMISNSFMRTIIFFKWS